MSMGNDELDENEIQGTGLYGSGNKSGKISRHKKAGKWRDFSNDTARMELTQQDMVMSSIKKPKIL